MGEGLDLLTDRRRWWIDGREAAAVSSCAKHRFRQVDAAIAAPGEAVIDDRAIRATLHRQVGDEGKLTLRIAGNSVDRDDAAHAESANDVDVRGQVFCTALQRSKLI